MPELDVEKTKLVQKANALAGEVLDAAEQAAAKRVIAEFYQYVSTADISGRDPRDLCGAALSLWRLAERRRTGQAKIRVYNPDPAADGWSSPHTIVEIAADDMPFLIDSVTGAINGSNRVVHLISRPILTVARDPNGRLREILDGGVPELRELWMQIEITRESDPEDLARLTQTLAGVVGDVRAAVEDWQPMRCAVRVALDELTRLPAPPVAPIELAEAQDFLRWLDDDNFTFLGYREYMFDGMVPPRGGPLGILRDEAHPVFGGLRDLSSLPPDVQDFVRRRELLVITKSNRRATVHRTVHMDAIGLRRFAPTGEVVGIHLFLGLFTWLAYRSDPRSIPLLRLKVRRIVERSGLSPTSHDGKALLHILDTLPRDELFQSDEDQLFDASTGILNLQQRQRIAVFVRRDPLERFVSCFVYVPRERYDSQLRNRFGAILEEAFAGQISVFHTHVDEAALAHIHFIIRTTRGAVPSVDIAILEERLAEAGRNWMDRLHQAAATAFGEEEAHARLRRTQSFPIAYQARTDAAQAVADLRRIETVLAGSPVEVSLHQSTDRRACGLRLYRAKDPVVLSDVLPIVETLGLRVIAEEPFRIDSVEGDAVWIHELQLAGVLVASALPAAALERRLVEAAKTWSYRSEDSYSCFISYSSKDDTFADRLHADLKARGVRCWFAPHDLRIGVKTWDAIDEAIRLREKLLIILSDSSITSDWVEDEVNKAYAEERERKVTVLFPIRIDDAVMTTAEPWARKLRDQRHIGDFQRWKEHDEYQKSLERLLRDLRTTAV